MTAFRNIWIKPGYTPMELDKAITKIRKLKINKIHRKLKIKYINEILNKLHRKIKN